MTAGGRTAIPDRPINPDCEVCEGSGRDVLFDTDCSECFRLHIPRTPRMEQHMNPSIGRMIRSKYIDANVEDVRRQLLMRKWRKQSRAAAWRRDHPITMRIIREHIAPMFREG